MESANAKRTHNSNQAILHIVGHPPFNGKIISVSSTHLTLAMSGTPFQAEQIRCGEMAELHIDYFRPLKIRSSIVSARENILELSFVNPKDADALQLVQWKQTTGAQKTRQTPLASNNQLINELTDFTVENIAELLDIFLQDIDYELFNLAEIAASNEQQTYLFEVKILFRQQSQQMKQYYCQQLRSYIGPSISDNGNPRNHQEVSSEDIQLVDLEEFEDWLSLETIIRNGNEQHYKSLDCLNSRYSQLLNQTIDNESLPVGIHNICHALQQALKPYAIKPSILNLAYKLFEKNVVQCLDPLYDRLNRTLKSAGILPNIESRLVRDRRLPNSALATSERLDNTHTPENTQFGLNRHAKASSTQFPASRETGLHSSNHPQLLSAARNAIGMLRQLSATQETAPAAEIDTQATTSKEILIDQLAIIQQDASLQDSLYRSTSLSTWLASEHNTVFDVATHDLLLLVDGIFQNIYQYPQITDSLHNQIKRLEIAVAKTALIDSSFLDNPQHPTQRLLNQLITLCLNSEMPNQALERKFDSVISHINSNYQQDTTIFEQAYQELSTIAMQQQSAFERNSARIAQTYEGRQRVQQAEEAVEREIQRRISPPQAPTVVVDLINNGWRELLKLTYIKLGRNSELWQEHLLTLDQLLAWITETLDDEDDNQPSLEKNLEADSFADLIDQQLHNIFPGDFRYQQSVENIRSTLKGVTPVTMTAIDANGNLDTRYNNELLKELEAANPQLSRWFKRAKQLKVGDEFSYLDDKTGQRNIKLAWISENKRHFVFVNNRGQKVMDFDLVDLANKMSQGLSKVEQQTEWPLVERSLYSTVQQAYEKLAFQSTHDELTGLISRKECERHLGELLTEAKSRWQQHCLLYIDIDKFSLINNLYGHVAGDQLILDLSALLQDNIPKNAFLARMAGNEFVLLLEHQEISDAKPCAETLRKHIEDHEFSWQGHPVQFTISIGLININRYTENVVNLLRNAISACQLAKQSGGNRTHDFQQDAELHDRREKLLSWIDRLNTVLSSDTIILRGQSIQPLLEPEDSTHYEILLAIKDAQGEPSSPEEFIEAAECYNRMQRVDRWVIENTFKWLSELPDQQKNLPSVSINLSGNSINDDHFVDFILEQFAKFKIPTTQICFEVTETATINNLAEAADFIREIKKVGCKFSLDDFGSGNASYQYLKHLPVDYLKIDGMFVKDIVNNKNDYALVKSINEIAHLMGKKTIAEYTESEDILTRLKEIGVDYAQGYAISKPIPLSQIII